MRRVIISLIFICLMPTFSSGNTIKQPNVSGQFYYAKPQRLSSHIQEFFKAADIKPYKKHVEIIIVPHAGYVFSGGVAAYGFKAASKIQYKTIVVIAASHYFPYDGFSIWQEGGFSTPLGIVEVDEDFSKKLIDKDKKFFFDPNVFEQEHSLEVELPFLQKTFKGFKIVPILAGQPRFETVSALANSLHELMGSRKDILVVISSDMSHFHDYETAKKLDKKAIQAIKNFDIERFWNECSMRKAGNIEMCGFIPVTTALLLAKERGLGVDVLKYANSGDVIPDKSRVVGYTSVVFYRKKGAGSNSQDTKGVSGGLVAPLTLEQKRHLIKIAKDTIHKYVLTGEAPQFDVSDPRLMEIEGAFVTIHKNGRLRGCIGNIIGRDKLHRTVRNMAIAAASQDPRFKPVTKDELEKIDIEVSVLSKPRPVVDVNEIEMGKHGVIVQRGPRHHGVFLPQVATETGWDRDEFLSQLCQQKAGLPPDAWKDPKTRLDIFTADVFSEKDVE